MDRINKELIGELLVEKLNIPQKYVNEILEKSKKDNKKFGDAAEKLKLIDKEKISKVLSIQYNTNYLSYNDSSKNLFFDNYKDEKIYKDLMNFDSKEEYIEFCIENKFYILNYSFENENYFEELFKEPIIINGSGNGSIVILIDDYDNFSIDKKMLNIKTTFNKIYITSITNTFFKMIETKYKSPSLEEIKNFFNTINSNEEENGGKNEIAVKMLLTYIISNGVSDLHLEPNYDNKFRISARIDGERFTFFYIDEMLCSRLINVIKNISKISPEVKRKPQDGQISGNETLKNYTLPIKRGTKQNNPTFDFSDTSFRVSTYPNPENNEGSSESVVLRVLNSDESLAVLENLNISKQTEKEILFSLKQRSGIIIVSGPTGSGKTTTLYAVLSKIDYLSEKIITFEDPVEIRNKFWTQGEKNSSANDQSKFEFIDAKKSILRQDPDVILMGEIRDEQSAQFALEAANTGHLVLATLHANSSILVISRLMELGVERNEIINSLRCAFSQRLVKRLCPHCRKEITEYKNNEEYKDFFNRYKIEENEQPKKIFELNQNGCKFCNYTGFKGRILIDEVLPFNDDIKTNFIENKNLIKLREQITKELKFNTMLLNGLKKVEEGLIPFSELNKLL